MACVDVATTAKSAQPEPRLKPVRNTNLDYRGDPFVTVRNTNID
jgi:hypothetical protein